jgi:phospholipid N-methyltransferase
MWQFSRAFLRNPGTTGALVPSSRFLAEKMLRSIDWNLARVIVELGPGIGSFTKQILWRMNSRATLIAIEANPEFTAALCHSYRDSRLRVVLASATQLKQELRQAGFCSADCIICGLPFANMKLAIQAEILQAAIDVLRPEGSLILFQYRRTLLPRLEKMFTFVDKDFELLNVPPAHVFRCTLPNTDVHDHRAPLEREMNAAV